MELNYELDYHRVEKRINKLFEEMFYDMGINEAEKKVYVYLTIPETGEKIRIRSMPKVETVVLSYDKSV